MSLLTRISDSIDRGTLDYIWLSRHALQQNILEKDFQLYSNASFEYYDKYRDNIVSDLSLNAITSLCDMKALVKKVDLEDTEVTYLSKLFNHIISSDRKLHKCYDCGTNARAMFLKLISLYRNKLHLTQQEQESMNNYSPRKGQQGIKSMYDCLNHLKQKTKDGVYICSIGVEKFGHVWIFEKITIAGKQIIRHYQSALKSHLVIDFISHMDYGKHPDKNLDLDIFFQKLKSLLEIRDKPWSNNNYADFNALFAFNPISIVKSPKPSFCWTNIIY